MERQPGCETPDEFAKLLAEARAGSEEAKGKLLIPYGELVRQWASQRLGRPFRIESDSDVSQEVFLRAWKNFDQFHGGKREELDGWMRAIFDNQFTSSTPFWHRDKRDVSREVHWEPARFEGRPPEFMPNLLGELIKREEEKMVGQAIEGLSKEEVNVILWRYSYHVPYEQIGTRINRTPDAARMFCHRAKEKLLELIRYPPPQEVGPETVSEAFPSVESFRGYSNPQCNPVAGLSKKEVRGSPRLRRLSSGHANT